MAYLVDRPNYDTAHVRVRRARGPASGYRCLDCGRAARQWAYNHGDPDQITGPVRTMSGLKAWSGNPDFYDPMCYSCHAKRDIAKAREDENG